MKIVKFLDSGIADEQAKSITDALRTFWWDTLKIDSSIKVMKETRVFVRFFEEEDKYQNSVRQKSLQLGHCTYCLKREK